MEELSEESRRAAALMKMPDDPTAIYPCPKCDRSFSKPMALRMHTMRVHSKAGKYGYKWARNRGGWSTSTKPRKTPADARRKKAEYQQRLRARYYKEGRNSKGVMMPPGWKPRPRIADFTESRGLTKIEQRRKYQRDWHAKNVAKKRNTTFQPIVYKAPVAVAMALEAEKHAPRNSIHFCPFCGENIERIINNEA